MNVRRDGDRPLFAAPPAPYAPRRRPFADVPRDAQSYAVRMRDGVRLATDVYLPARGRKWPVLLSRLPYDKAGDECFMPDIARWFNERGYAVVVQDVRGKIRSGGATDPFVAEAVDGYDTIDWIVAQRWCGGPVGMFGDSYFGWTQWAAAASHHRALRAITPRVISADAGDITMRQGVFCLEVTALWAMETWVDEALYDDEGRLDWGIRPLSDVVPAALGGRRSPFLDGAARGRLHESAHLPVRGDVPALHIGGWWDIVQPGQIATWRRSRTVGREQQLLVMDSTDHGWTHLRERGESYRDPRTDDATLQQFLDGYLGPVRAFVDQHLSGAGGEDVAPVRWMLAHETWRDSEFWPPRESRPVDWYLRGRVGPDGGTPGALDLVADSDEDSVSWVHDPHEPVPSIEHAYHPLIEPVDESELATRDDVLTYETSPLREPLDLAGPVSVTLGLGSSATSTHVVAAVSDVAPDGSALRLRDGAAYVHAPWPAAITVELGDTGYRLHPGHRLRLTLSSSAYPRYLLHPGSDEDPWTAVEFRQTCQHIVVGGARAAYLRCFALNHPGGNS